MKKKMNKGVKAVIILLVVIAVIAAGLLGARKFLGGKKNEVALYTVKNEVYENVIEISGVVSAAQQQTLQALSAGTVVGVFAKQGDTVKEGDVLIQMDDSNEQYALAKQDYDMAQVAITGSARQYQLMKTQRKALVQKIAERKVTATFDGIIADMNVSVGASLSAQDSVGTIVDVSYLTADVEIAETDVAKLQVGQKVEFTFPACSEKVEGYVVGWPAIGSVTNRGATVVKAKVRIDEYPESILPNFSFSGKIKISEDENFLLVSRYAIGREDGKAFVVKNGSNEKIEVNVVPYGSEYVKIVKGNVSEGDVLVAQSKSSGSGSNRGGQGGGSNNRPGNNQSGGAGAPPPRGF